MAKAKKAKVEAKLRAKPTIQDFDTIIRPVITEKTMLLMQEENKVTLAVQKDANKTQVKLAFEKIFDVKVKEVNILNVVSKATTRGGKYKGILPGYKKAIVTVAEGEAIDLFKE